MVVYLKFLLNYLLLSLIAGHFSVYGFLDRFLHIPLSRLKDTKGNPEKQEDSNSDVTNSQTFSSRLVQEQMRRSAQSDLENIVKRYGYPFENHEVKTEDGYFLSLLRIKHGKKGPDTDGTERKPVMLQHGIMDSAHEFLAKPEALAYFLADKGYDVWIGNCRGTILSRRHVDKDKDPDKEGTTYWDFSFHEMGKYDLPAALETIQKNTGNQTIHYIGNSMGSTMFLVMGSECPERLNMIDHAILMAPVCRPSDYKPSEYKIFNKLIFGILYSMRFLSKDLRLHEAKPARSLQSYCTSKGLSNEYCEKLIKGLQQLIDTFGHKGRINIYAANTLSESLNSYLHFWQIMVDGKFQKFDYGKEVNMIKYQQERPPEYNLRNINKKLYLLVGGADPIVTKEDALWLQNQLPSSEVISEKLESFEHTEFYFGKKAQEILYGIILNILNE